MKHGEINPNFHNTHFTFLGAVWQIPKRQKTGFPLTDIAGMTQGLVTGNKVEVYDGLKAKIRNEILRCQTVSQLVCQQLFFDKLSKNECKFVN
jgi:hypothetical protein